MTIKDILIFAESQGLLLTQDINFNDMGIDFKVGFAIDIEGKQWVLRIPRRKDMDSQIEKEKRILEIVKNNISVEVPDWKICSPALVANPLLKNKPVLTFDAQTYEVSWNMNKDNPSYVTSLAKALVEIHDIPETEAKKYKIKTLAPNDLRLEIADRLQVVKSEIGISHELETRYRKWLDNDRLWPDFTVFVHGDLYAGHVLVNEYGIVSGLIDWSTAHVGDPSIDFSGHVSIFGEESLKILIHEYEKYGGKVWDKLYEQVLERAAAAPLAYGYFAIECQDQGHIAGAKAQLGIT